MTTEVGRRCEKALGLCEFPMVRRRLFARLQRCCVEFGDIALCVVADALVQAESLRDRMSGGPATADSKGRWFCKVVVIRLTEQGFWEKSQYPLPAAPPDPAPTGPVPRPAAPPAAPAASIARAQETVKQLVRTVAGPVLIEEAQAREAERIARVKAYWARVQAADHTPLTRRRGEP